MWIVCDECYNSISIMYYLNGPDDAKLDLVIEGRNS